MPEFSELDMGKVVGPDGKSAYSYAVDGGYTGTEAEFQALMGTGPWLPVKGGTITGHVHMSGSGRLQYDSSGPFIWPGTSAKLPTLFSSGAIAYMGNRETKGSRLQGVADPVYGADAANKDYVDQQIEAIPGVFGSWGRSGTYTVIGKLDGRTRYRMCYPFQFSTTLSADTATDEVETLSDVGNLAAIDRSTAVLYGTASQSGRCVSLPGELDGVRYSFEIGSSTLRLIAVNTANTEKTVNAVLFCVIEYCLVQ